MLFGLVQVTPDVQAHLDDAGVEIKQYDALLPDVKGLAASGKRVWTDPDKVTLASRHVVPACNSSQTIAAVDFASKHSHASGSHRN